MSNKIEEKVSSTFQKATPDISQSVIADCKNTTVYRTQPTRQQNGMFWKVAALALALVLVITGVVGGIELGTTAQAAVVVLDVNPSIQLKIDGKNRIIDAVANNQDAQVILQGMNLQGSTLDTAVYAIIGSMTVHGYLSEYTNSVLVSVDTKKESTYNQIIEMVTGKIQVTLQEHNITSSVVSQWIKNKDIAGQIANEYNISMGKATLIAKIVSASSNDTSANATTYTVQDLANRSVNELALILANYAGQQVQDCITNGNASEKAYIGKNQAVQIALTEVGIDTNLQPATKVDFDIEEGVMVYEVEFVQGDYEYEVDVKAVDGEVLVVEKQKRIYDEDDSLTTLTNDQLVQEVTKGLDDVTNVQVDSGKGNKVQISFQSGNYYYQVEISPKGTIWEWKKHLVAQDGGNIITEEKIKQIALEMLSHQLSFLDEQIEEIDCELSDDGTYYEVEIELFGFEFEFYIDAKTGEPMRFGGLGHNHNK